MKNSLAVIVLVAATLTPLGPAAAAAPQYGGIATAMVIDPITENWTCTQNALGAPSVVPPGSCTAGSDPKTCRCYAGSVKGPEAGVNVAQTTYDLGAVTSHGGLVTWIVAGGGSRANGPGYPYHPNHGGKGGDSFVVFQSADSHSGRRGTGMVLMNDVPRPDDGGYWFGSEPVTFRWHSGWNKYVLIGSVNYPCGEPSCITQTKLHLGESLNGYSFTWRTLANFKQTPTNRGGPGDFGYRVVAVLLTENPSNSSEWVGVWTWTEFNGSGGFGDGTRGTSPAKLDFSQATPRLCLGFENLDYSYPPSDPYDFQCYGEGTVVDWQPIDPRYGTPARPARMFRGHVMLKEVTTSAGASAELWWTTLNNAQWCASATNRSAGGFVDGPHWKFGGWYTAEENCALDRNHCFAQLTDPALYLSNRNNLLGGTSEVVKYQELDLGTLWVTGAIKTLNNPVSGTMRAWPSPNGDHGGTYNYVIRHDWNEGAGEGLYVTVKRSICVEPYTTGNERFHGFGVAFVNLNEQ